MSTRSSAVRKKAAPAPQPTASASPLHWIKSQGFLLGALLAIATFALYLPVTHHPFVNYDDLAYIVNNPHIGTGLSWDTVGWAFTTFDQFTWHPLTWISHALDVQLYQIQPGGHHLTNLLFQIVNVLLLFWVLRRATGYVGRSAMVAGLFALHPMNVETVAWIAERKNLLSMFFFLLGLAAYRWYVESTAEDAPSRSAKGRPVAQQSSGGRYALVAVFFALGLLCKPQIITFPFVLLLWDYWPLRRMSLDQAPESDRSAPHTIPVRSFWWLVKEKIPLFVLCAGSALMTIVSQKESSLGEYPFPIRLTNAIVCYARYIGKAFWPTNLALLYPHPWHTLPMWQVLPSLTALAAITIFVLSARSRRYLLVGWLWFLGTLVPMIGLVHVGNMAMADRYSYLPFIGLFIMVCWGVADMAANRRVPAAAMWGVSVVLLAALTVQTHRQLNYWDDNMTLWRHTLAITDGNYIAHDNLGQLLMDQGQTDEAIKQYREALAIYASDPSSNLVIAVYDHQHGDLQGAIARYQQMISITPPGPGLAELYSNTGLVYLDMRDNTDAQKYFEKAVAIDPKNVRGWLGQGVVADRSGDLKTAIQNYQHANSVTPMKVTCLLLAKALEQTGDMAGAQAARERARLLGGGENNAGTNSSGIAQP